MCVCVCVGGGDRIKRKKGIDSLQTKPTWGHKAYRTLAAIQDTVASVGARRQRRQSDRHTLPTSALAHKQHTRTKQFSARCSIYGKASRREDKSSTWLHPPSLPIETIVWWCFAAGVNAATLESEEKANKRIRTFWN